MSATVTVGRQGRIVIPSEIRKKLGIGEGDDLRVEVRDGALRLVPVVSRDEAVRRLHGSLSALAPHRSLVDELLAERRAEVAAE